MPLTGAFYSSTDCAAYWPAPTDERELAEVNIIIYHQALEKKKAFVTMPEDDIDFLIAQEKRVIIVQVHNAGADKWWSYFCSFLVI